MNGPRPAAFTIEQPGKDTAAVEPGQAAPIDRPVETDQGGRAHIAYETVG
jgi:hypothetical protein